MPKRPSILLIDNYDSFTYNLVHLCHQAVQAATGEYAEIEVVRNDAITVNDVAEINPQLIVISPGPGRPDEAGISKAVIRRYAGEIPIFGVCLGMQAIAECFGAQVVQGDPIHGHRYPVTLLEPGHALFENIPDGFDVVRYHSLKVVETDHSAITPLAQTEDGTIMALAARQYPMVWGVQFHPESIGSQYGVDLLRNVYRTASHSAVGELISRA